MREHLFKTTVRNNRTTVRQRHNEIRSVFNAINEIIQLSTGETRGENEKQG